MSFFNLCKGFCVQFNYCSIFCNRIYLFNYIIISIRENEENVKPIHLKKVAAGLARALWDLSEAGIVHGAIRCRRLLLASHHDDRIIVKLSGPTLRQYSPLE